MMDSSKGQCNQGNDISKYNEEDNLDPRIQVMSNFFFIHSIDIFNF